MKEYTDYISVTDHAYGNNIRNSYINGNTYGAYADWGDNGVSRDKLVLWAESHDTYCNKGESQRANQDVIDQVYAIVASRENEAALYFSRPFKTGHHEIQSGEKMIRYIVRKLRGDYTLWTNLNHRIDVLEKELKEIKLDMIRTEALLSQIEKNQASVNLALLKLLEIQKEQTSKDISKKSD